MTLFLGWQVRWGAFTILLMLLSFAVAVSIVMVRGQNLSCSCFGLLYQERVGWHTLVRDVMLIVLGSLVFVVEDGSFSIIKSINDGFTPVMIIYVTFVSLLVVVSLGLGIISKRGYLFPNMEHSASVVDETIHSKNDGRA